MKQISINAFRDIITKQKDNPQIDFINVCTPIEYKEKHIEGVRNVPLDSLDAKQASELTNKKTIYIHCNSGARSCQAIKKLESLGVTANLINIEGGLTAWEQAGYETISESHHLPIIRQVMLIAGILIFISNILAYLVNDLFIIISFFISIGFLISGITGWCGMAKILSKMPWNKE